ncbi:class I SAM-dependent methyltransferase [Phenylobacterium soli]|uniref:SAM-dependent methyltransferase n=1 Tax=Phenylobacterium soli TaxID=2170551 RepID=A0A328AJN6_9CAUL|nr:class I SAM-dependent methyltransferase [Phenylobacterium soli]RAK54635.1 SAM-dependent methyltransferase [Phenylobacterium soli]
MTHVDTAFTGSIPELYDRYLARMFFQPYADAIAARLQGFAGELLEVAAGTGVVTRTLDRALPRDARITATDLNEPMLRHAQAQGASERVSFRQANGQDLPFADGRFDAVVCQFGMMFFPDRMGGYREARRVLRPGGTYLATIWDDLTGNAITRVAQEALAQTFADNPPMFMARTPHGHGDVAVIRREVEAAGFAAPTIETLDLVGYAESAEAAATGICQGTPLRGELEARGGAEALERATEAVAVRLRERFGTGPIDGALRAHLITARR